jgi:hypothetical protein
MPVIEAQCASILVPHDHRHINHVRRWCVAPSALLGLEHGAPGPSSARSSELLQQA